MSREMGSASGLIEDDCGGFLVMTCHFEDQSGVGGIFDILR